MSFGSGDLICPYIRVISDQSYSALEYILQSQQPESTTTSLSLGLVPGIIPDASIQ